jgi:hypothetical protein
MRLWTLHPSHLDSRGLVALWREGLLAKAVLRGRTRGYRNHPQLARFKTHRRPVAAINTYLAAVHAEASRRGFNFDARKLRGPRTTIRMAATRDQLRFERAHLLRKLRKRSIHDHRRALDTAVRGHPIFRLRDGPVAEWEIQKPRTR